MIVAPGIRIPHMEPCLITTNHMLNLTFSSKDPQTPSAAVNSCVLLHSSEQMWNPGCGQLCALKIFPEHLMSCPQGNTHLWSQLPDYLSSVSLQGIAELLNPL